MQQVTVDTPASSITAVPIQHVPWAKVIAEDLINPQSRPGSPNTLVMAASELTGSHGRGGRSGKREPQPPPESRALTDITGSTPSGSCVVARKDGEEADNLKLGTLQLAAIASKESDFAADWHQVIPTDKCFGLPIVPRQSGGFKPNYKDAVEVTNFQGIYSFESGYLRPGYTNTMPYDHPLDWQGHITSALHSGVTAYSSYIRLIALGILLPQKKETGEGHNSLHYFDVVGSVPQPETHAIWGHLHSLPLVLNVFLSHYDLGTFSSHSRWIWVWHCWLTLYRHLSDVCSGAYDPGWHSLCWSWAHLSIPFPLCWHQWRLHHLPEGILHPLWEQHWHCPKPGILSQEEEGVGTSLPPHTIMDMCRHCHSMSWSDQSWRGPSSRYSFIPDTHIPHDVGYKTPFPWYCLKNGGLYKEHSNEEQKANMTTSLDERIEEVLDIASKPLNFEKVFSMSTIISRKELLLCQKRDRLCRKLVRTTGRRSDFMLNHEGLLIKQVSILRNTYWV